ncbi:very short patch repair endonuclease [Pseudarthrobacter cellobiosi]|uniref:very short patch repair endonuclease n=1 Tax=Pseudarthrobacter cellobiosi TaxID=2953654 RepID=UPI00208FB85C|nr:very short patch repair endonuclease [Pseudarthrobacter sp. HLT1-5]MCO4253825.1 very short patch repair endonuclease [Pseudarthrobacter sp. HLT1-5]
MADFMTPGQRSSQMAKVRSKNSKIELLVRRELHRAGYRYRLHDPKLPGRPDLVFASRRCVIFINGCFWHAHDCSLGNRVPKSNTEFWSQKRLRNRERDAAQRKQLSLLGWQALDVWECELKAAPELTFNTVQTFLAEAYRRHRVEW